MASEPRLLPELLFEDHSVTPAKSWIVNIGSSNPLRFGRDPETNNVPVNHTAVSRNHLEFYVILYDQDQRPMLYVQDRQSANGTYVNDALVGIGPKVSSGRLLETGDRVTIEPFWSFTVLPEAAAFPPTVDMTLAQRCEVQLIDRFLVTNRSLGQGAHATALLAIDKQTGQQLICKSHDLGNGALRGFSAERAMQEASILSQLDHPNIISFKQAFFTRNSLFLFIELASGGDLFSYLSARGRLQELEVRWITRQILCGLEYIHGKGIVHRDLKAENVLFAVCPSSTQRIVLCDFGLSAIQSRGRMKSFVGTSKLQAPEMMTGDRAHGKAVDIWAAGLLVAKLLTGTDDLESSQNLSNANEWLTNTDPGVVSEAGRDFLRRCLTSCPKVRMTARQALQHPWLQDPLGGDDMFRKLEEQIRSSWKPREVLLPIVTQIVTPQRESDGVAAF